MHCCCSLAGTRACDTCPNGPSNQMIGRWMPVYGSNPPQPWICPKCGRAYSGMRTECYHCNNEINEKKND